MNFKTVREFHWVTKIVILLTLFVLVIPFIAYATFLLGFSINGLGLFLLSLTSILMQVFLILLVVIVIYMAVTRVKQWMEKYMDAMLSKMDLLAGGRGTGEDTSARLAVMGSRIEEIEKKVDNISDILEKVAE